MFIGHMRLAFCEMVLYVFCPFLSIILFALFLQIYSSSLYILDTNPLLIVCVANTFFRSVIYLFLIVCVKYMLAPSLPILTPPPI